MKKKLLAFLVCVCLALGTASSISAFAGVNLNSPTGIGGLISGGGINADNFTVKDDATTSAYSYQVGNTTYDMKKVGWRGANIASANLIPAADVVEGSKFVIQFNVHSWTGAWGQSIYPCPFSVGLDSADTIATFSPRADYTVVNGWPADGEIWIDGQQVTTVKSGAALTAGDTKEIAGIGIENSVYTAQKNAGKDYVTFWLEYEPLNDRSMTIYAGHDSAPNSRTEYATLKKAYKYDNTRQNYACHFYVDANFEFDNVKMYRVKTGADNITYVDCDFEDPTKVTNAVAGAQAGQLIITGVNKDVGLHTYDSEITVTNPAEDSRIVSKGKLAVDDSLDTTFDMIAKFKLENMVTTDAAVTRKVGVALGLDSENEKLSEAKKASLIYLTVKEEEQKTEPDPTPEPTPAAEGDTEPTPPVMVKNIYLGAVNIENGTVTQTGTETLLEGVALGDSIVLALTGKKDGSVDVTVNDAATPVNFPAINASGCVAVAHLGTGAATYRVDAGFNVTGYRYASNEQEERISANFDGGFIPDYKFNHASKITPDGQAVEGGHKVEGMIAEDGKVGFYGTSTGTRLLFKDQYADFVMQFDYTSLPYGERGLPLKSAYGAFFIVFGGQGADNGLGTYYTLGIRDGNINPTYGAESFILTLEGKKNNMTPSTAVLSTWSVIEEAEKQDGDVKVIKNDGIEYRRVNEAGEKRLSLYNKTSRFMLVVSNNNVALYVARVDDNGEVEGNYIKVISGTVPDSFGKVGFATENPHWSEIDNVSLTPLSKAVVTDAENTVDKLRETYEVGVADMETDKEPEPLAKPVLTVDRENKKVTWAAVDGAESYLVTVKWEGTTQESNTPVTGTEFNLADYFTDEGTYEIAVQAVPADEYKNTPSRSTITYTIEAQGGGNQGGSTEKPEDKGCGCKSSMEAGASVVLAGLMLTLGAVLVIKRKKA